MQVRLDVGTSAAALYSAFVRAGGSFFSRSFYLEPENIFQLRLPGGGNAIAAHA